MRTMSADAGGERERLETALAAAERRQTDLEQRLVALVDASGTLFGSPELDDVIPGVILLARTLVRADGYALWRYDPASNIWQIGGAAGISDQFCSRIIQSYRGDQVTTVPFAEPLVAESVQTVPMPAERMAAYRAEGIASMLAVPLTIAGHPAGTIVFYYRTPHQFADIEVHTARALGNMAAAAITTAQLYEAQRRSSERVERANRQAAILAEASAALASTLDYEVTLRTVARLAVPLIADWCTVDIVDERGDLQRLGVAHVDPDKIDMVRSLQKQYSEHRDSPGTVSRVIRSGRPVMTAQVTDEMLVARACNEEHLRVLRGLGLQSVMVVPLAAHGHTFGALSFVTAESGRAYTEADFRFAQDLASRASLAVENARAYRQVSAANRAKDEFLATLSHELRTPLNAVLGWARMLRDGKIGAAKMARAVDVIERNAAAQLDLVEDLLDLSRIITGKFRLNVGAVDLAAAIDAAVEAVQPAATAKGITIQVAADPGTGDLVGDAQRLQQAVWNLLSNAIKFTSGAGRVTVTRRRREDAIEIEVRDTGEGVEPAVQPFIFDRFRQADSGTTRAHTGLGLGLAIVRHIAELHGGTVSVTSPGKGQGSTFLMSLPVAPADHRADSPPGRVAAIAAPRPSAFTLAGIRAIIVDDDRDALDLVTEALRSRGADVTPAASASECLAALDRDVPDVILSDIAMPEQDGFDLIRLVRERPVERGGRVPAVALTAYARPEDRDRSLASGFQVHLSKPVDLDELLVTVADLAGSRPG